MWVNIWLTAGPVEMPVAILRVKVPVVFAGMLSEPGLKVQAELAGSPLHPNVNVPLEPFKGVRESV